MKFRNPMTNRTLFAIFAVLLAIAVVLTGTYTWTSFNQGTLNETKGTGLNPGGRLHDDFDGENKDVYVENFGTEPIFIRVRLDEYMEIGRGAGLKPGENGYEAKEVVIFGDEAEIGDLATWTPHIAADSFEDCEAAENGKFHEYWQWYLGGSKIFMPTFNKDKNSFKTDYSGKHDWESAQAGFDHKVSDPVHGADPDGVGAFLTDGPGSHGQWTDGEELESDAWYSDGTSAKAVHKAKSTLLPEQGGIMTMQQWIDTGRPLGNFWVLDVDGWCYWGDALAPGEATSLLLDRIEKAKTSADDWYYAISLIGQFADIEDIDSFGDEGGEPTQNARELLRKAAGITNA